MSHTSVPDKVKTRLWVLAGGRCHYCNQPLWRDEFTLAQMNAAYVAHIVADSPSGPRGDSVRSPQLSDRIENLMLLCDVHHRLVDREELNEHPEERLLKIKAEHEARIELLTSIIPQNKSHVVTYVAPIGSVQPAIALADAYNAMMPAKYFPADPYPIQLSLQDASWRDDEPKYWETEVEHLERQVSTRILERYTQAYIQHVSLFAFAPQPLLIKLGSLLPDTLSVEVYPLLREPQRWGWDDELHTWDLEVTNSQGNDSDVALVIALSARIEHERVFHAIGKELPVWTITIQSPDNDSLRSREQLAAFRKVMRRTYREIKEQHGEAATIHIFPAVPIVVAVEIGRVRQPKADLPIRLWEQNHKRDGFFDTGIAIA